MFATQIKTRMTPPKENAVSDHTLVFGNIHLLHRIAPNHPKRVGGLLIYQKGLMADRHLRVNLQETRAAKFSSPIPGPNTGSVDDMTSVLAKALLSNAADIAPLLGAIK